MKLPHDFALYANGTLNSSSYNANGNVLAQTPRQTGAIGLIYDRGGVFRDDDNVYASLITKFIGPQYGADTATVGQANAIPIKSYSQVDLAAGYTFNYNGRKLLFKVNLYNVTNDRSIIGYAGQTIGPPSEALYWMNSGRSVFFSLAARI